MIINLSSLLYLPCFLRLNSVTESTDFVGFYRLHQEFEPASYRLVGPVPKAKSIGPVHPKKLDRFQF